MLTLHTLLAFGLMLSYGVPTGESYQLGRATLDGGGGRSSANEYTFSGSIGQPDTGTLRGGAYALQAGFWTATGIDSLFSDRFEEN